VKHLRAYLPPQIVLHYAMKANPMPALVAFMARLVDGLDVASGGELAVALDAGIDPKHVSFAGPGKSVAELEQAAAAGILLNVESAREVRELARVAVRVNPDFELKSSGMRMGGGPKPFGVDAEQVPALLAEIGRTGLAFEGFHIYSGSQNLRAESICEAQRRAYELAARLADYAPAPLALINIGGGFGIP
jgi:diaminopimelate decarboxylase